MTDATEDIETGLVNRMDAVLVNNSRADGSPCPVCGSGEWFIIQNPNISTIAVIPMGTADGDLLTQGGIPSVTLTCQKCGFVRQHVKQLFDNYVKALKEKSP